MPQATAQAQYLQLATSMFSDFTHSVLSRGFRPSIDMPILPGFAHLTDPIPDPPPPQLASQGPLPALADLPGPSAATVVVEAQDADIHPVPREVSTPSARPGLVPPSMKSQPASHVPLRPLPPPPAVPDQVIDAPPALPAWPPTLFVPLMRPPGMLPHVHGVQPRSKAPSVPNPRLGREPSPSSSTCTAKAPPRQASNSRTESPVPLPFTAFSRDTRGKGKSSRTIGLPRPPGKGVFRDSSPRHRFSASPSPGTRPRRDYQRDRRRSRSPRRSPRTRRPQARRREYSPRQLARPSPPRRATSPTRQSRRLPTDSNPYNENPRSRSPPRAVSANAASLGSNGPSQHGVRRRPPRSRIRSASSPPCDTAILGSPDPPPHARVACLQVASSTPFATSPDGSSPAACAFPPTAPAPPALACPQSSPDRSGAPLAPDLPPPASGPATLPPPVSILALWSPRPPLPLPPPGPSPAPAPVPSSPADTTLSDDDQPQPGYQPATLSRGRLSILTDAPDIETIATLGRFSDTINNASMTRLLVMAASSTTPPTPSRKALYIPGSPSQVSTQIFAELERILPCCLIPAGQQITIPSASGPIVVQWLLVDFPVNVQEPPPPRVAIPRSLRSWRPPPMHIGPANSLVFVPFLRAASGLLTALEEAEWRSDHRTTNQWAAMVLQAGTRSVPLIQIITDMQRRISISDTEPRLLNSAASTALHRLQSSDLHHDLGLCNPLSPSDSVTLPQLVPRLQLADGYIDAVVQESLIASFMPRPQLNWLMGVTDAFREEPGPAPATPPVPPKKGRGKRSISKHSPAKGNPKGAGRSPTGRARGRGARGKGARTPASPLSPSAPLSPASPKVSSLLFPSPRSPPSPSPSALPRESAVPPLSPNQLQLIADNRNRARAILALQSPPSLATCEVLSAPHDAIAPPPVSVSSCRTIAIRPTAPSLERLDISWHALAAPCLQPNNLAAFSPVCPAQDAPVMSLSIPPPAPSSRGSRPSHAQVLQLLLTGTQVGSVQRGQIQWLSHHSMFQLWQSSPEEICAICQQSIAPLEAVATTGCLHHFHALCLSHGQSRALSSYGLCPTCRSPLTPLEVIP